ncbi:MAG: D-alanyl-D-alanine carboxypeptidase [Armatimonadetes bacterium]|nr:D-alanyl-D-alanine carboxypeptidase [Armatimonadota bacterium]
MRPILKSKSRVLATLAVLSILPSSRGEGGSSKALDPVSAPPPLTAESAILMDVSTGAILWERNSHLPRPPASLTKIMTALLILEDKRLGEWVTVSPRVRSAGEASAGLEAGDQISQRDLLYAILLKSANDACVTSAEHVATTVSQFADRMNRRAAELGAMNTHFVNPHGLNDPQHLTSAYDLAVIARHALTLPTFREAVETKVATIYWRGVKGPKTLRLINKNRLLSRWGLADGVKTGYTRQAGRCLVASATEKDWQLLAVVLKAANTWDESQRLLKYGFSNFRKVRLVAAGHPIAQAKVRKGTVSRVPVILRKPLEVVVTTNRVHRVRDRLALSVKEAPLKRGDLAGWAIAENGGHELARVPVFVSQDVEVAWTVRAVPYVAFVGSLLFLLLLVQLFYGTPAKSSRKGRTRLTSGR